VDQRQEIFQRSREDNVTHLVPSNRKYNSEVCMTPLYGEAASCTGSALRCRYTFHLQGANTTHQVY
jgi:hypothetical protein